MKNLRVLLRNADPLRHEPILPTSERDVRRKAILSAASRSSTSAGAGRRSPKPSERVRPVWKLAATAALAIAVLVPVAIFRNIVSHQETHAIIETGDGSVSSGGQAHPFQSGQRIGYGDVVRSSGSAGAVVTLADGSRVEMRAKSEISLKPAADGVQISLGNGSIIVSAAKQRAGHLYVQTRDCTVSVVGTVFLVSADDVGSRVAVIQGEVHVRRGTTLKALLPGEQIATASSMKALPVVEEISWSRDAAAHLVLLKESAAGSVGELDGSGGVTEPQVSTEKAATANPQSQAQSKEVAPAALPALQPLEDAYNTTRSRALAEKAKGNLKGAIAGFGKAIKLRPAYAEGYNNRGLAEYAKGDFKGAIADFNKAIELKPDYTEAYDSRAAAEYARGDYFTSRKDEAKATDLKKALTVSPPASSPIPVGIDQPQINPFTMSTAEAASSPSRMASVGEPVPDISFATCPTSQPAFARGEVYRAYPGCALPQNQVAILNLKGTRAMYVDGISAYNVPPNGEEKPEYYLDNSDSLELLPGRHTIRFVLADAPTVICCDTLAMKIEPNNSLGVYVETHIEVEAGKTYTAIGRTQDTGRRSTIRLPGAGDVDHTTIDKQFWVEVSEFKNDPAAYLQLYRDYLKNGDSAAALSTLENYLVFFPKDPNHKAVEKMAEQLRASFNKTQLEAYRNLNSGPQGPAAKQTQPAIPKVLGCVLEQSGKSQPNEKTATPLTVRRPANGQAPPDLGLVLSRATRYVQEYEAQLGNLIGEEVYVQNEMPVKATKFVTMFPPPQGKQQRTESDFAILQVGQDWIGVREVNCLDGVAVKSKADDFQNILDDSSAAVLNAIDNVLSENAHYNIGVVQRNTNLPTFALRILRTVNSSRFEFKKTGETIIGGIRTWAVGFQEIQGPTLIHDNDNHDELAKGTLWIEPETGHVLKTEMNVAGRENHVSFRAQTVVSYKNNPKLEMLVPVSMEEHYDTDGSRKIDCRADYFNFHRFQVDTHLDFGPLVPSGDSQSAPAPGEQASPPLSIPAAVRPASPPLDIVQLFRQLL